MSPSTAMIDGGARIERVQPAVELRPLASPSARSVFEITMRSARIDLLARLGRPFRASPARRRHRRRRPPPRRRIRRRARGRSRRFAGSGRGRRARWSRSGCARNAGPRRARGRPPAGAARSAGRCGNCSTGSRCRAASTSSVALRSSASSMPTAPNSLTTTAVPRAFRRLRKRRTSVVLPAPRKPVTMVTGIRAPRARFCRRPNGPASREGKRCDAFGQKSISRM